MGSNRLEAFSDGVLAIIITIMVLEMKVPHGHTFAELQPLAPVFLSYILSFIYLAVYWNNHHHLMHMVHQVTGSMLWANMHLLFWLSLVPFVTGWMGENNFAGETVMLYGIVLFMAGVAYKLLQLRIIAHQGREGYLARALGRDLKGNLSMVLYLTGILVTGVSSIVSLLAYAVVAVIWMVPDRRIERVVNECLQDA